MNARGLSWAAVVSVFLWSCQDGTAPLVKGIHLIASPSADTIGARPVQSLTVQAIGDGSVASGKVVRFESVFNTGTAYVLLGSLSSNQFNNFAAPTADKGGTASVLLEYGSVAGDAQLVISVPELGLRDTVALEVLPGAPSDVRFSVQDTSVLVGQSYALSGNVVDRFGNPRTDQAVINNAAPTSCSYGNGQVTALAMGRCLLTVEVGAMRDTARASALPLFRMAVVSGGSLRLASPVGDNARTVLTTSHTSLAPAWAPDGSRLVIYEGDPGSAGRLSVVDTTGVTTAMIGFGTVMASAYFGRFSPDGQWVYFTGRVDHSHPLTIWRMRPDGTQLTEIVASTTALPFSVAQRVSVSPDGLTLAFDLDGTIALADAATGQITPLGITGSSPTFSPDGQRIAYIGSFPARLFVAGRNGSNVRELSADDHYEWQAPQWTSDGQWLLVKKGTLTFVNVESGVSLPLTSTGGAIQGSVRPPFGR